jgi:DNA-binding NtrC family response regulator
MCDVVPIKTPLGALPLTSEPRSSPTLMEHAVSILVLVWDLDDPVTVKRVTEAVDAYHSAVIPCSSAESILFAIQHETVDVVILSLQKPFQEAFHLLSEIKTKASQVEVIFVSEFDDETRWLWMEAIQCGAYEFLPKPLDLAELHRILVQATEKHHPVKLKKRPPAQSLKDLSVAAHKGKAS